MQITLFDDQINFMGSSSEGLNDFTRVAQRATPTVPTDLWGSQN